ncbi:MAG: NAD(P)-binding protein [Myxococcota bacterium]
MINETDLKPGVVNIVGAGVAGMTAAHELAQRGFSIGLFEAAVDSRTLSDPRLGGLAANQYGAAPIFSKMLPEIGWFHQTALRVDNRPRHLRPPTDLWADVKTETKKRRAGRWPRLVMSDKDRTQQLRGIATRILDWAAEADIPKGWASLVFVGGIASNAQDAERNAEKVKNELQDLLQRGKDVTGPRPPFPLVVRSGRLGSAEEVLQATDYRREDELSRLFKPDPSKVQPCVVIALHEELVPGEHGYRFFPGFYKHLFDTMRRTFIPGRPFQPSINRALQSAFPGDFWDPGQFEPSLHSVFDNLISVDQHAFASESGHRPVVLPRTLKQSWAEFSRFADAIQHELGITNEDAQRGQLATFRYLTSCPARREQYERTTWFTFSRGESAGPAYRNALVHWPQALVGLRADLADARTFGSITMQLLLSHIRKEPVIDGTLNGPTTEAWLDPWIDFLREEYVVTAFRRNLDSLRFVTSEQGNPAIQLDYGSKHKRNIPFADRTPSQRRYIALALPPLTVARLGVGLRDSIDESLHKDLQQPIRDELAASPIALALDLVASGLQHIEQRETTWDQVTLEDVKTYEQAVTTEMAPPEKLPYRHFAGIQFFMHRDYEILDGHIYYPDSEWRLSSISQGQFRGRRRSREFGYRGAISVIIGAWNVESRTGKVAWKCDEQQLAEEVWQQLSRGLSSAGADLPETPPDFFIDQAIHFGEPTLSSPRQVIKNSSPYLVNTVELAALWRKYETACYRAWFGDTVVFCGTWLPTSTRIPTMEAANESARRATNALLNARMKVTNEMLFTPCSLYDVDERELDDLEFMRRLDRELTARGLPHLVDILKIESSVFGSNKPDSLGEAIRSYAQSFSGIGTALVNHLAVLLNRREDR